MSKGLSGGEGCLLIILFVLVAFAITFVFGGIILQAGWERYSRLPRPRTDEAELR